MQLVSEAAGGGFDTQRAPRVLLRAPGLFDPAMREMRYEFGEPFIVDHSAFAETLGGHATPLDEAIHKTVRWYRAPER